MTAIRIDPAADEELSAAFDWYEAYDGIGNWGNIYGPDDVVDYTYGFLVLPGDGYLAVDEVLPEHE